MQKNCSPAFPLLGRRNHLDPPPMQPKPDYKVHDVWAALKAPQSYSKAKIIPYYVHYEGCAFRCRPFRQKVATCTRCCQIIDRQDVFTNTSDPLCPKCGLKGAPMDNECDHVSVVRNRNHIKVHRCVNKNLSHALHGLWTSKAHPSADILVATKLTYQASGKVEAKAKITGDAPVPPQAKIAVVALIQRRKTTPGLPYHQTPLSPTLQPIHTRRMFDDGFEYHMLDYERAMVPNERGISEIYIISTMRCCQGHIVQEIFFEVLGDGSGPLDGPHLVFEGLAEKGGLPSLSKAPHFGGSLS
ncbi:hypothetical protein HPB51_027355 [Rhipicephalus microplus]|uniref:Uncharacterized protein n=1 Tax=Rhipicephalus microplus TaxID=6941 RepID=A0A9J6D055_RHIMP|nr:hypothetical protein HPB51_027355 [Rhipicephalus microplus]